MAMYKRHRRERKLNKVPFKVQARSAPTHISVLQFHFRCLVGLYPELDGDWPSIRQISSATNDQSNFQTVLSNIYLYISGHVRANSYNIFEESDYWYNEEAWSTWV